MSAHIKYPVINGLKQCGDCGQWKPVEDYKRARNHYASRCDICIKIYQKEYRMRLERKVSAAEYAKDYIKNPANRDKRNAYKREWMKLPHAKTARNDSRREWAAKEKQKAVDYKGGKCVACGYSDCLGAMDFHHPDPTQKEGLKAHWTFERNKPELDKCVLVCARCHREIHAGFRIL